MCSSGRISVLEEEARQQRQALSKIESEKRQLQDKLTDLEKVGHCSQDMFYHLSWALFSLQIKIFFSTNRDIFYRPKDNDLLVSLSYSTNRNLNFGPSA